MPKWRLMGRGHHDGMEKMMETEARERRGAWKWVGRRRWGWERSAWGWGDWSSDITLALINGGNGAHRTSQPTWKPQAPSWTRRKQEKKKRRLANRNLPLTFLAPKFLWPKFLKLFSLERFSFWWLLLFFSMMQLQLACMLLLCFTCGTLCSGEYRDLSWHHLQQQRGSDPPSQKKKQETFCMQQVLYLPLFVLTQEDIRCA